ncbi:MAG TPA: 4Fe-4S binding protein [Gammaproteobacteria bacterium]|nr:4Fe-4S binding protein [Gammaproteobacteria bacterium]
MADVRTYSPEFPTIQPGRGRLLARLGHWMRRNRGAIQAVQWAIVCAYVFLLVVPALLPLPPDAAGILDSLTVFAQFVFWGIWWPFVILSMVLVGRTWCGVFCPEGALSEVASRHGLGRAIPRWMRWGGWPFVAFAGTTLYGQLASVYDYPGPALVVLGGSTMAAIVVGAIYGRNKRVWCRYLCPVNGVFGLLAKLSPLHFRADEHAWQRARESGQRPDRVNCPPLLALRGLDSASGCHMCGRCSGHRGAIALEPRRPGIEIETSGGRDTTAGEYVLLVFGMIGLAMGAFQWSASPWYITVKQAAATWLVGHGWIWPLQASAPWWLLTDYPAQNDVLTLLDASVLLLYVVVVTVLVGGLITAALAAGALALGPRPRRVMRHLAHALIPVAGAGLFVGLFGTTLSLLRADGVPVYWAGDLRAVMFAGASLWSLFLGWRLSAAHAGGSVMRRLGGTAGVVLALVPILYGWWLLYWGW